jgi:hypothetical protein
MRGGFTRGMLIGGVLGASIGVMMEGDGMKKRRVRMMKNGRKMVRASSDLIDNFTGIFR